MTKRFIKPINIDITSEPLGLKEEKVGEKILIKENIMNYSITYIGVIIILLSQFGIPESDATITIKTIGIVIGAIITFLGRWRKGDINVFGIRKKL